jgi:hypothetical protein
MSCSRTGASLRKQIIENIILTLAEKIGGDDYNHDLNEKSVSSRTLPVEKCPTYPYISVNGSTERKEDERESQMYAYMTVVLWLYVKGDKDSMNQLEDLIQDVEKAMYIDHTRGDLAVNTVATGIETDNGWLQPYGWAQFTFEIQYRYFYGSP